MRSSISIASGAANMNEQSPKVAEVLIVGRWS